MPFYLRSAIPCKNTRVAPLPTSHFPPTIILITGKQIMADETEEKLEDMEATKVVEAKEEEEGGVDDSCGVGEEAEDDEHEDEEEVLERTEVGDDAETEEKEKTKKKKKKKKRRRKKKKKKKKKKTLEQCLVIGAAPCVDVRGKGPKSFLTSSGTDMAAFLRLQQLGIGYPASSTLSSSHK